MGAAAAVAGDGVQGLRRRATMTTMVPRLVNSSASAAPMPLLAPVMTTTASLIGIVDIIVSPGWSSGRAVAALVALRTRNPQCWIGR
jgi:hypothetical protein